MINKAKALLLRHGVPEELRAISHRYLKSNWLDVAAIGMLMVSAVPLVAQQPARATNEPCSQAPSDESARLGRLDEGSEPALLDLLNCLLEEARFRDSDPRHVAEYPVHEKVFPRGRFITAKLMSFGPDGHLVLSPESLRQRRSGPCDGWALIQVHKIRTESDTATITWHRTDNRDLPFDRGQAPSGSSGVQGRHGAAGAVGAEGNPGFDGESAPSVILVAQEVEGPGLVIDLRGQAGGTGGVGQTGGDGGAGADGRPAVLGTFSCKRPPGAGGNGGGAGAGGKGGPGGQGGGGGTLIVVTQASEDSIVKFVRPLLAGGPGGPGGAGGRPGEPGRGGREAPPEAYCRSAGSDGEDGARAALGQAGDCGEPGFAGDFFVLEVESDFIWRPARTR